MNEKQREFLIKRVEATSKAAIDSLDHDRPVKPSLNNYLISAILDGTVRFQDISVLTTRIKEKVIALGPSEKLVEEADENSYEYRRRDKKTQSLTVGVDSIFVIPQGYLDAHKAYKDKKDKIEEKSKQIRAQTETIILKLQLGTSASLDKLIEQASNLVDLDLLNTSLVLGAPDEQKKLSDKK